MIPLQRGDRNFSLFGEVGAKAFVFQKRGSEQRAATHRQYRNLDFLSLPENRGDMN
jgi:hypothetical protein